MRSAVVVPVPEAAGAVDRWREQTCRDKPSIGVPAHITLVFPFAPAGQLDDAIVAALEEIVGSVAGFDFELRRTDRFPDTLFLAPEPAAIFVRLTEEIVRRFPDYPPYEGAYDVIVPHLTVAHGEGSALDEAEADVERALPIAARAREAVLLEEIESDWGRWQVRAQFPFA